MNPIQRLWRNQSFEDALLQIAAVHTPFIDRKKGKQIQEDVCQITQGMSYYQGALTTQYGIKDIFDIRAQDIKETRIPLNVFHIYATDPSEDPYSVALSRRGRALKKPLKGVDIGNTNRYPLCLTIYLRTYRAPA